MTLEALPSALDGTASDAREAAEQANGLNAEALTHVVRASMPGSTSVGAANELTGALNKRATAWSNSFRTHAEDLAGAAHLYRTNEKAAEEAFTDPTGSTLGHRGVE